VRFVDSHLHLDSPDAPEVIRLAGATDTLLLGCGVDRQTSLEVISLAAGHPETVKAFAGVHPSEAAKEQDLGWVGDAVAAATGVGEIGLDPTYSEPGAESAQMGVFRRMLEEAEEKGKAVQVHSREAEPACLEVLGGYRLGRVLMHWLESEESLPAALDRGYFVSFGPALIYSKKLQRMARGCDQRSVLVESDSPVGYSPLGGVHGPSLVPSVVFKLAELWGEAFDEVRETTTANAARYLGSPEKG
jgi:TatD DNase family protein